jgi:hypothetical protein
MGAHHARHGVNYINFSPISVVDPFYIFLQPTKSLHTWRIVDEHRHVYLLITRQDWLNFSHCHTFTCSGAQACCEGAHHPWRQPSTKISKTQLHHQAENLPYNCDRGNLNNKSEARPFHCTALQLRLLQTYSESCSISVNRFNLPSRVYCRKSSISNILLQL